MALALSLVLWALLRRTLASRFASENNEWAAAC
jgi:hypothetical protein